VVVDLPIAERVEQPFDFLVAYGAPKPAAILGIPVGFVGAAESKEALAADPSGVPYLIVRGRIGGSAMTAAAVNALARAGL